MPRGEGPAGGGAEGSNIIRRHRSLPVRRDGAGEDGRK